MKLITQDLYNKIRQSLSHDLDGVYIDVPGFIFLTVWQCHEPDDELFTQGCLELIQSGDHVFVRAIIKQDNNRIVVHFEKVLSEQRLNGSILYAMKVLYHFRHPGSYGVFDENKFMPKAIFNEVIQSLMNALTYEGFDVRKNDEHSAFVEFTGCVGLYPQVRIEDDYGTVCVRVWPPIVAQDSIIHGPKPGTPLHVNIHNQEHIQSGVDKILKAVEVLMPKQEFVSSIGGRL